MYKIIIVCLVFIIYGVISANVEEKIQQYFESDVFKAFQKHWQAHRKSFENAIATALKQNYGVRGMNVFVRRAADPLRVSNGFYITDNVVDVLLLDMALTNFPILTRPEVTFALASNVLRIESGISKVIVDSYFHQYRNQSDVVFHAGSDLYEHSPFSYQQVEQTGKLAIIADECSLVGYGLVKLSGHAVNLGQNTFQVNDCKFTIEISSRRWGTAPIIAPYFTSEQAKSLEVMLSKPIVDEMLPKLQATIFTILNTSVIFDNYLLKFRKYQDDIFKEAVNYVTEMVKNINSKTVESDLVTVTLPRVSKYCNMTCQEGSCYNYVVIDNVTVHGLDTLYSSHTGGPFKLKSPKVSESLRFHSLMVRGDLIFENNTIKGEHGFAAEIRDTTVNFEIDLASSETVFKFLRWRSIALSIVEFDLYPRHRNTASSFVHGYLLNELPKVLEDHLSNMNGDTPDDKKLTTDQSNVECITNTT